MSETKTVDPWQFDLRIRPRQLKSGTLAEKDLQKYLAALPDLEDQVESFTIPQPALEEPEDLDDEGDDAPIEA